jgi:hypothetical protein
MALPLEQLFPNELSVLCKLFSDAEVLGKIPRLNEIHFYIEKRWGEYVEQFPDGRVKHLLIGEAPPWSDAGAIQYVLCPAARPRTLMRALRKVFSVPKTYDSRGALDVFARRGLLVVDSIPFPMKYSSNMRRRPSYENLVRLTARTYLNKRLNLPSLSWDRDVRIAFGFKLNALSVIKGLDGQLRLGGHLYALSLEMIGVNRAGYPDAAKLRKIWDIR